MLLLGLVMMITPGPGVVGILAGLTILAAEFAWARRLLRRTHDAIGGMMPHGMRDRLRAWLGGGPEQP